MKKRTVLSNIPALFVNVLEFSQCLDDVDVLSRPSYDMFGAFVKAVVQHFQRFQDMAPILAFVVQSLVEDIHDLVEGRNASDMSVEAPRSRVS